MGAELEVYLEFQTESGDWIATPVGEDGCPESVGYANKYRELFAFLGFGNVYQYDLDRKSVV